MYTMMVISPQTPINTAFVYGTLQIPVVLETLIGRVPSAHNAVLRNWRAAPLKGYPYPGLVPDSSHANGLILNHITAKELVIFDNFEGEQYRRITTMTADRTPVNVYALEYSDLALPGAWDLKIFIREHLDNYLIECKKWIKHYHHHNGSRS